MLVKKFRDFYFRNKVMMSYHTSYNFLHGNVTLSMYLNFQTIARCYHAYQSVLFAVGEKLLGS